MDRATELLTVRELAERLRVSPDTVRAWARRGAIPSIRLSRKATRFDLRAVLAALEAKSREGVRRA